MNLVKRLRNEPLSLMLKPGDVPFELTVEEAEFGPDDWAWQFLRLNQEYRQAYAVAQEKQQKAGSSETRRPGSWALPHPCQTIRSNEDDCRRKFGLSTWLNPENTRLPNLEQGESWFSPLHSVVVRHDHLTRPGSYPWSRGPFGAKTKFVRRPSAPFRSGRESYAPPHLYFLIDSSIPPDSQLAEISGIAAYVDERSRHGSMVSGGRYLKKPVVNEFSEDVFSCNDLGIAREPGQKKSLPAALWSTVEIDFRHASARAIDEVRIKLSERHKWLVQEQLAASPPWQRLRIELFSPRKRQSDPTVEDTSRPLTDGHSLKAYAVIAELVKKAGPMFPGARGIEQAISELCRTAVPEEPDTNWREWLSGRELRIGRYITDAQKFVEGRNYRWLIYMQKP